MGSQQFCLRWNNHQTNMLSVFDQLLASGDFVDVTLACDGGVSIKAHKMVLSACSPYFQNLFKENPCRHPIVILKDMRYAELRAIVDFMYKGEINVSQDQLSTLLKTAESLKVKGLAEVSGGGGGVAPNGGGGSGGEAGADASQLDEPGPSSSGGHGKHGPGGVGSPGLDGNASPHSRRKRHRPARRPSNSDNSNTELPSGSGVEQRLAADPHEVLTIPKSEPVDLLGKSQVEMMMETESHYQMDMALSERTRSQDPLDRDSSLGAHSDGHLAELSQPSTSGTQPSSQDASSGCVTHSAPPWRRSYQPVYAARRSPVWEYFTRDLQQRTVQCLVCGDVFKKPQNTTNLFQHLRCRHAGVYALVSCRKQRPPRGGATAGVLDDGGAPRGELSADASDAAAVSTLATATEEEEDGDGDGDNLPGFSED